MKKVNIKPTLNLLIEHYGNPIWKPDDSPLAVLIRTILSQNTSDTNSNRAFRSLLDSFSSWEDIASAGADEISSSIRMGGLGKIKAKRIKQALGEIQRRRGSLDLSFLNKLSLAESREWLRQLPGVGTKTANCVLLFSLGRPALPVDTHIFRSTKRLGLVDTEASVEQAHDLLERLVPSSNVYQFHVLLIEHGRKVCKAQRPRCRECTLQKLCPSYVNFAHQ